MKQKGRDIKSEMSKMKPRRSERRREKGKEKGKREAQHNRLRGWMGWTDD
jgi:hypothetical protein